MIQLRKNAYTLSMEFETLLQNWESACLADSDLNEKQNIATQILKFYEKNLSKMHFLEQDLKVVEEIKMFLFFYCK